MYTSVGFDADAIILSSGRLASDGAGAAKKVQLMMTASPAEDSVNARIFAMSGLLGPSDIVLDNASSTILFRNPELLQNVTERLSQEWVGRLSQMKKGFSIRFSNAIIQRMLQLMSSHSLEWRTLSSMFKL